MIAGCGEAPPSSTTSTDVEAGNEADEGAYGRVVILGDSLTAGYGLDPDQAYPALLQVRIDEEGLPYEVVNAGVSGDTTSVGPQRLRWHLKRPVDVVILALGGNDGLRGIDPDTVEKNLRALVDMVHDAEPDAAVILAGMESPPNMGPSYTSRFREVFPRVAESADVALIPFLLEGVGGEPSYNQADGIHPNAAGQVKLADNVWDVLRPILEEREESS